VLKVTGENRDRLERAGAFFLSMDQTSLGNGRCLKNVPCTAGIPKAVTLYGGCNAYIATMGIGVQAVTISDAAERLAQGSPPSNPVQPGLYAGSSTVISVETAGDRILAGDTRILRMLPPGLAAAGAVSVSIPARAVHGIPDFPADLDGDGEIGKNEKAGLIFVAGNDRNFYIVRADSSPPATVSKIGFGTYLKDVRVSPYDRLAYVSGSDGNIYIIDIDSPFEGTERIDKDEDGKDDRILGTVAGLSGAGAIDLGRNFGYVGDTANGKVLMFLIHRPVTIISPAEVFRDRIFDFTVSVYPPEEASGKTFKIELSQGQPTQNLKTRENVQMYDFGYTDNNGTAVTGVTDYTFQPEDNGRRTFKAVINKAQAVRIRVTEVTDSEPLTGESREITVSPYVRKYAAPPPYNDYNQHDSEFVEAAEYWGDFYQHPVDPDLLKAIGIVESDLGNTSGDIMAMGKDGAVPVLRGDVSPLEYEADIPNNTVRPLEYPEAEVSIYWATCWLYHKAQRILVNPSPPPLYIPGDWHDWDTAAEDYNIGDAEHYLGKLHRAYLDGMHPRNDIYLWPILTNGEARRK